jgi:hypothetical protein
MMQAQKAKLTRAIEQIAAQLSQIQGAAAEPEEKKARKGLFGFLGSGAK